MNAVILALAAAALGPGFGASAPPAPATLPGLPPHPPSHGGDDWSGQSAPELRLAYEREADALRTEMHALQQADGGELTAEHRTYLRKKAEALVAAYNRDIEQSDPMGINADGSRPR